MKKKDRIKRISEVMRQMTGDDMTVDKAKELLEPVLDDLVYLYENEYLPIEDDHRIGDDTYGYVKTEIVGNLFHISDRWGCGWRVRWLIDLLRPEYYPYEGDLKN